MDQRVLDFYVYCLTIRRILSRRMNMPVFIENISIRKRIPNWNIVFSPGTSRRPKLKLWTSASEGLLNVIENWNWIPWMKCENVDNNMSN